MSVSQQFTFRPIGGQILIRVPKRPDETIKGGIIVPTKDEPAVEGTVVALGRGARNSQGEFLAFDVKPDDRVLFSRYGGTEVKLGDERFTLVTEESILGVLT